MARRTRQHRARAGNVVTSRIEHASMRTGLDRRMSASSAPGDGALPVTVSSACGLVALVVYLRTLAPSVTTGDSGELITAAWLLGVAHPSGYPLFTLLGHLFTFLPVGSPAYRVNLMSAVLHAATVAIVALCIHRLLEPDYNGVAGAGSGLGRRGRAWAAISGAAVGGLALAFSIAFWTYAVVAEVFALNSFFAALILFLLLEWQRRPERVRLLWAFGLVSGLAATNHQTIVLLAPACLLLLIAGASRLLDGRSGLRMSRGTLAWQVAITLALLVLGLVPYVYLPFAARSDPALSWGDPRTLGAFWRVVTRADYGTFRLTVTSGAASGSPGQQVGLLLRSLWNGFTPAGCLLAAAGAWWLGSRRRMPALALALAFLFAGPAFLAYASPPVDNPVLYSVLERFYILPTVFLAVAVGVGASRVVTWVVWAVPTRGWWLAPLVCLALFAVPVQSLLAHYDRADQSDNLVDRHYGEDILAPLETGGLFIVQGDVPTMVVDYLQLVEGYRPDVVPLNMEKLKMPSYVRQMRRQHPDVTIPFASYRPGGDAMARLVEANLRSRPVYMLGSPQDRSFGDRFDSERAGFATRLLPRGTGGGLYAILAQKLDLFERAHYPTRTYPDTTFESTIVRSYGRLAFDVAYVLDDGVRDARAIDFYRLAITLAPSDPPAYKNLGLILFKRGDASAVAPLWRKYLRLAPQDEQAPAIRERLRQMGKSS